MGVGEERVVPYVRVGRDFQARRFDESGNGGRTYLRIREGETRRSKRNSIEGRAS